MTDDPFVTHRNLLFVPRSRPTGGIDSNQMRMPLASFSPVVPVTTPSRSPAATRSMAGAAGRSACS